MSAEPTAPLVPPAQQSVTAVEIGPDRALENVDVSPFRRRGSGLHLALHSGVVHRSLDFTQDIYERMRALRAAHYVVRLAIAAYPAFALEQLAGRIGVVGRYEQAFAGSVRDVDFGADFDSFYSELFGGLRLRHPIRTHELGFDLTFGRLRAGLDDRNGAAGVPDVSYSEARAAIDGTFQIERLQATAALGFRVPLGYGELSDAEWFPRVGGYGLDASLLVNYWISSRLALDVSASLRRFVLEMNSEPEDGARGVSEIAGGAVDAYLGAYVGVSLIL